MLFRQYQPKKVIQVLAEKITFSRHPAPLLNYIRDVFSLSILIVGRCFFLANMWEISDAQLATAPVMQKFIASQNTTKTGGCT